MDGGQNGDDRLWWYKARVLNVVDGDTIDLMVDAGFEIYAKKRVRLYGIDTPEVYGVKKDLEEYAAGKKASAFTEEWCTRQADVVLIRSHDGRALGAASGKYGRWIVEVFPVGVSPSQSLNAELVSRGLAEAKSYA